MLQKTFRLAIAPKLAISTRDRIFEEQRLNGKFPGKIPDGKLYTDLLKRQARRVMQDVTECPSHSLPAQLARLDDLKEIISHAVNHDFKHTPESSLSGAQLAHPHTLADFLACIELTRREHRAPSFVNSRDAELAEINHKVDLLAGLVAQLLNVPTPAAFCNQLGEEERA